MSEPFIRNHQYNFIKQQATILQRAYKTVHDSGVLEAVRGSAESKIMQMFPDHTDIQKQVIENIAIAKTAEDFEHYLHSLEPYLLTFPHVTDKQIKKLFPKNKKLKIPDLSTVDLRYVTYLGWIDISTHKLFMIYHLDGKIVGIEGRYTPIQKKNLCFLCNDIKEVALVSARSKAKLAHIPDYYKSVGNYMCINSQECNRSMTDVANVERFIHNVLG
ncbi:FusB/FusC family EF-G-binding protein [Aneurinibacillus sp. REN35]|uniref:FusB/FusC family EF-G-binding protein n=1 Tax=Aneurinibacillus sp. REN35 TaxID=3237286 RepID=UPI0035297A10